MITVAYAPGKIILFGEHAVVYGRPAIAVPVTQVQAQAEVQARPEAGLRLLAPDLGREYDLEDAPPDDALAAIVRATLAHLGVPPASGLVVRVSSSIPMARGLGSGTAISVAVARALARHFGRDLPVHQVSALAYQVDVLHHGTPSGIDNTVIAYEQPVYFIRGGEVETIPVKAPLPLVIADTGVLSPTRLAVGDVRRAWQADQATYEGLFDRIGAIAQQARIAIETGQVEELGLLMNRNQELLQAIGVSSPGLERLIEAARAAGALGAKLSGAGRGGNMIALVARETGEAVAGALRRAGAAGVIVTEV